MQTLLTVDEVITTLGLDADNSRRAIARGIEEAELHQSETSIGYEAYEKMLNALASYTAQAYENTTTYAIGEFVTFQDLKVYESLASQTGVAPTPANIAAGLWRDANKFDTSNTCAADFEVLWQRYMKRYLSFRVMQAIAVNHTIRFTGKGMTRAEGDLSSVVSGDEMREADRAWSARARRIFNAMQAFVKREDKACYRDFKFYEQEAPAKRRRLNKKITFGKIRY